MDTAEIIKKLDALDPDDPEVAHKQADTIILKFLRALGHRDVAKAYDRVPKWYA